MVVKKTAAARRRHVGIAVTRLEGLPPPATSPAAAAAVEVRWKRPASWADGTLSYLMGRRRRRRWGRGVTAAEQVAGDGAVVWEAGEANRVGFDWEGPAWDPNVVSVSVLYGFEEQGRGKEGKLEKIGTAKIGLEELAMLGQDRMAGEKEATQITVQEKQVPITLKKDGWTRDATLYVNVEFVELNAAKEIKRTLSVQDKSTREERRIYDSSTFDEVFDLFELLELADKESKTVVYRNKRNAERSSSSSSSSSGQTSPEERTTPKHRFLPWRRRSKESLSQELSKKSMANEIPEPDKDDDPVGSWKSREFISRDAQTKLKAQVFFASIDQRAESAGGESACTALVAVLADALHNGHLTTPTKPEFDALIREGSSEWRKLCDNAAYMERFPNKHFDLETILDAKVRPVSVLHDKAFVGFFQPESFTSLAGAMSFDDIWREISSGSSCCAREGNADVYIVSWNDHFFVLKVEKDAHYIIDTLGERLFEGCNKAYMLKFDDTTEMYRLPTPAAKSGQVKNRNGDHKEELIVRGKECCREFISRFLASIPLREELEIEKKGSKSGSGAAGSALHRRLQIEFHFTVSREEGKSDAQSSGDTRNLDADDAIVRDGGCSGDAPLCISAEQDVRIESNGAQMQR